jgi:hypothetical protein
VVLAISTFIFTGCANKKSKKHFFASSKECGGLFREKYLIGSWGALSADTYSDYITDSINFRVFVGIHGDDENFEYECKNDSLIIIRLSTISVEQAKVIDTLKTYSVDRLKFEKKFE